MQGQSTLGIKKQIEIDKPEEKFLLYFNGNEPAKRRQLASGYTTL